MPLIRYLKRAFTERWNLLALGGALALAVLSGHADVAVPLIVAGELAYLGLLGTHPRFQRAVDAAHHASSRQEQTGSAEQALLRIMNALPGHAIDRFESLRTRCLELRQIAMHIKDPGNAGGQLPLEELQLDGLDRLLWIYLRLLFTHHSLERFLRTTREEQIQADIARLEGQIQELTDTQQDPQEGRVRRALEDNLTTCRARLTNYEKARDNARLMTLEIDRLENKIHSLSELAVNRQEPDFISVQVDQVASSMLHTERTMSELQFATGLETTENAIPELVQRKRLRVSS